MSRGWLFSYFWCAVGLAADAERSLDLLDEVAERRGNAQRTQAVNDGDRQDQQRDEHARRDDTISLRLGQCAASLFALAGAAAGITFGLCLHTGVGGTEAPVAVGADRRLKPVLSLDARVFQADPPVAIQTNTRRIGVTGVSVGIGAVLAVSTVFSWFALVSLGAWLALVSLGNEFSGKIFSYKSILLECRLKGP